MRYIPFLRWLLGLVGAHHSLLSIASATKPSASLPVTNSTHLIENENHNESQRVYK